MRAFPLLALASILLVLVPLASAEETFGCHSWEVFVGDRQGVGAGVSTDDAATYVGTGHVYLVNDGVRPDEWIFSIWLYEESGENAGLQRNDETCYEMDWPASDTITE